MKVLDSEFFSAFKTATGNYVTTCFCAHTRTKTMGFLSFLSLWLVSSFHSVDKCPKKALYLNHFNNVLGNYTEKFDFGQYKNPNSFKNT